MERWADWELQQRKDALHSLIASYAEISPGSRRHRMYLRELDYVTAEMARRANLLSPQVEVYQLSRGGR